VRLGWEEKGWYYVEEIREGKKMERRAERGRKWVRWAGRMVREGEQKGNGEVHGEKVREGERKVEGNGS
jgi:hypothetical protein